MTGLKVISHGSIAFLAFEKKGFLYTNVSRRSRRQRVALVNHIRQFSSQRRWGFDSMDMIYIVLPA